MRFEKIVSLVVVLVSMSSAKAVTDQGISERLNRNIARKTGVSLKIAFQAVVGHDPQATSRLLGYASNRGTSEVEDHYLRQVAETRKRCDESKAAPESCALETRALMTELAQIRDSQNRSPASNSGSSSSNVKEKLFVASLIYYHQILSEVLEQEYAPFKARCKAAGAKLATCDREKAQLSMATDAAMDLVRVASAKARGNMDTQELENELKLIIGPI